MSSEPPGSNAAHSDPSPAELQAHIEKLQNALEIATELASERDINLLLDLIVRGACRALFCERASLFLYDAETEELYTRVTTQLEVKEIRVPIEKGIVGLAAREGKLLHIPKPYEHPLFFDSADRATGFKTRDILCVPLKSCREDRLLGVLELLNRPNGPPDEREQKLLQAFAAHIAVAIDRAILEQHYEEKRRLTISLEVAREVQKNFLPSVLPTPDGYEIAAVNQPAEATGGDYCDAIPLPSDRLGLVMADVSGHGLGSSLLMSSLRSMLRYIAGRDETAIVVLSELGAALHHDLSPRHRFITCLYGVLDPLENTFHYSNAGHGPIVLHFEADSGRMTSLLDDETRGFPLGLSTEPYVHERTLTLAKGDLLVFGTDGIVETRRDGEQFGMERFCELLKQNSQAPLPEIIDRLMATSVEFQDGVPDDDLTLMIVRRT